MPVARFARIACLGAVLAPTLGLCPLHVLAAQDLLTYHANYDLATPSIIHVSMTFPSPAAAPVTLVMPRTIPGGYAQRPYDPFVTNVHASSANNTSQEVHREKLGPRWAIGKSGDRVRQIDYDVDVARMEREILAASDSSKIRPGYAGLLGYSIFAYVDEHTNELLTLRLSAPQDWPVFSTLDPHVPPAISTIIVRASNYYALADSQIVMGPKAQLSKIDGAPPLFICAYAESRADIKQEAELARDALDKVTAYFGKAPFTHYSVILEFLKPLTDRHQYNFSMEHLDSGTFYFDTNFALAPGASEEQRSMHLGNYAHHIAHSWIPKRAYGENYLPFRWEMTPVLETIWFNEGFGRYISIQALADAMPAAEGTRYRKEELDWLQSVVDAAPPFLRHMSLAELSREGSFLYADDFRTGMNLFSRGALMAAEMDDAIRAQTNGQKSLRDALRHLIAWTSKHHRAFRVEELPQIFREATGVDTSVILNRHLQPLAVQ